MDKESEVWLCSRAGLANRQYRTSTPYSGLHHQTIQACLEAWSRLVRRVRLSHTLEDVDHTIGLRQVMNVCVPSEAVPRGRHGETHTRLISPSGRRQ